MQRFVLKAFMRIFGVCVVIFLPVYSAGQEQGIGFPLSTWSKEQIQKLPDTFWSLQRQTEKSWATYISRMEQQYAQVYGPDIKNGYDLFLQEQTQAGTQPKHPQIKERKTLRRLTDLVGVPGRGLGRIKGTPLGSIRVLAFKAGALRVIPHDVMECTAAGRLVLPYGPEGNPKDGDGVLGDADTLYFMAMDAGDRVGTKFITDTLAGAKAVIEIELTYAQQNEQGWVYVAAFGSQAPETSVFEYVKIFPEAAIIYSPFMLVQSMPRAGKQMVSPTVDVRTWAVAPSFGGTARDIHNKLILVLKVLFRGGFKISQNQDESNLTFRAWYAGPVIVYGRATWKMKTPLGIGAPVIFADLVGTAFTCTDQNFLWTPFDPSIMMKTFNLTLGEELNQQALMPEPGAERIITSQDRKVYPIKAQSSAQIVVQDAQNHGTKQDIWHVLTGPAGSMCMYAGLNDYLTQHAQTFTMLWQDSPEHIGAYLYNLDVTDFKNRQESMFLEWYGVPFFWDNGRYNWGKLDLVLKPRLKPLTCIVDGSARFVSPRFVHVPNIKEDRALYRY
ncbi:MAG: hypothetical protein ABFD81_04805 [Syntrophaceae bacterium]